MASIFAPRGPGQVVKLQGPLQVAIPFAITLVGNQFASAIVTSIEHAQSGRVQVEPSFADANYYYLLGENPSNLRVSGVSFQLLCTNNGAPPLPGFDEIDDFYQQYRAGAAGLIPVALGRNAYKGLLLEAVNGITDPEFNVGQWSMTLTLMPDRAVRRST